MRNTAYLLCRDWHLAEDLTQVTFTKLYRCWHRIERHEALDQYARRVLLRAFLQVLATARRSAARRYQRLAAGYGLAAVTAAVVALVTLPGLVRTPPAAVTAPGTVPAAGTPTASPPVPPPALVPPSHVRQMFSTLIRALPAGFTGTSDHNSFSDDTRVPSPPSGTGALARMTGAFVQVTAGAGTGELAAVVVYTGRATPTGDLCAAALAIQEPNRAGSTCEAYTVGGLSIPVVSRQDPQQGRVGTAYRYLRGGFLMVQQAQGVYVYAAGDGPLPPDAVHPQARPATGPTPPPLAGLPLDARQLAAIAADPAMLP